MLPYQRLAANLSSCTTVGILPSRMFIPTNAHSDNAQNNDPGRAESQRTPTDRRWQIGQPITFRTAPLKGASRPVQSPNVSPITNASYSAKSGRDQSRRTPTSWPDKEPSVAGGSRVGSPRHLPHVPNLKQNPSRNQMPLKKPVLRIFDEEPPSVLGSQWDELPGPNRKPPVRTSSPELLVNTASTSSSLQSKELRKPSLSPVRPKKIEPPTSSPSPSLKPKTSSLPRKKDLLPTNQTQSNTQKDREVLRGPQPSVVIAEQPHLSTDAQVPREVQNTMAVKNVEPFIQNQSLQSFKACESQTTPLYAVKAGILQDRSRDEQLMAKSQTNDADYIESLYRDRIPSMEQLSTERLRSREFLSYLRDAMKIIKRSPRMYQRLQVEYTEIGIGEKKIERWAHVCRTFARIRRRLDVASTAQPCLEIEDPQSLLRYLKRESDINRSSGYLWQGIRASRDELFELLWAYIRFVELYERRAPSWAIYGVHRVGQEEAAFQEYRNFVIWSKSTRGMWAGFLAKCSLKRLVTELDSFLMMCQKFDIQKVPKLVDSIRRIQLQDGKMSRWIGDYDRLELSFAARSGFVRAPFPEDWDQRRSVLRQERKGEFVRETGRKVIRKLQSKVRKSKLRSKKQKPPMKAYPSLGRISNAINKTLTKVELKPRGKAARSIIRFKKHEPRTQNPHQPSGELSNTITKERLVAPALSKLHSAVTRASLRDVSSRHLPRSKAQKRRLSDMKGRKESSSPDSGNSVLTEGAKLGLEEGLALEALPRQSGDIKDSSGEPKIHDDPSSSLGAETRFPDVGARIRKCSNIQAGLKPTGRLAFQSLPEGYANGETEVSAPASNTSDPSMSMQIISYPALPNNFIAHDMSCPNERDFNPFVLQDNAVPQQAGNVRLESTSSEATATQMDEQADTPGEHGDTEVIIAEEPFRAPLGYHMPSAVKQKVLEKCSSSREAYWQYTLYRGPNEELVTLHYCKSKETSERIAKLFLGQEILGFDIEWKANAVAKDGAKKNVALIQLASEERIALFHIARYPKYKTVDDLVAPTLKTIMESNKILKANVAVKGDCTRLRKYLDINSRGLFELSHLYKLVKYSLEDATKVDRRLVSLALQVEEILGLSLWKGDVRSSDWTRDLDYQQSQCKQIKIFFRSHVTNTTLDAASDSYAAFQLFHQLESKRKALNPTPPRPAHAELNLPIQLASGQIVDTDDELDEVPDPDATTSPADSPTAEEMARDFLFKATKISTTPAPKPAKLSPPEVVVANEWVAEWRNTLPEGYKARALPSQMRAYALWHHQRIGVPEAAALLRDPPLMQTTVTGYILEAIRMEKLDCEVQRVKTIWQGLPESSRGRFRSFVKRLEASHHVEEQLASEAS